MSIDTIGVVGAGQMGNGIAHACALAGYPVVLVDVSQEQLDRALQSIGKNLDRQVSREHIDAAAKDAALERITTSTDNGRLADAGLVIEAVPEREDLKRKIYESLAATLKPEALIVSNTSSISITRLASATDRPGKFMGMHFFNPVPVMKLVELIRGMATEEATYEAVAEVTRKLGKTPAMAVDSAGFIVNRILLPMINEAVFALFEGVASVEDIDAAMKHGAAHPMGPLQLADFIGLDTCLSIMQVLHNDLGDPKYRPCPLLLRYVEAGWLGRKSGRGFYDYAGDEPVPTR
ncbi:MAG: 3-hydroxybutyryl-CoA dehydrogenase [Acetobacterales bacterium]